MHNHRESWDADETAGLISLADAEAGRRTVAQSRDFVRRLADATNAFANSDGVDGSETASLAQTLNALASETEVAAGAVDACLGETYPLANSRPEALAALATAQEWAIRALRAVDAAAAVYADVCLIAADRLAIAEEHIPAADADHRRPTAGAMVTAAQALQRSAHGIAAG